jgi:RNA polymerase sigma-70 factor (ECF subfamily)
MKPQSDVAQWYGLDLRWVYSRLLAGISRRTPSMQQAYDVLHDALLRYALFCTRQRISQPHAYLRTVVGSVLVDHHREASRYLPLSASDRSAALPGDEHTHAAELVYPSAEHLASVRQRLHLVQQVLDVLPPRCGEVFWLFRIEGRTQAEIARQLGISVNMVERHVMRALIDLRAAREAMTG